jgi:hypothetical protein
VFIGFGFPARLLFVPIHVLKRKGRLKPANDCAVFLIASGRAVKISRW